jgi:hypothetical protein
MDDDIVAFRQNEAVRRAVALHQRRQSIPAATRDQCTDLGVMRAPGRDAAVRSAPEEALPM